MSVQALSLAFAVRGLSPSEKLTLLALANYADDKMACWPSQETLSGDTELSARTIWGALQSLEGRKLISRASRKRSDGTRATDIITLHFAGELRAAQPLANSAKSTRKVCQSHSQMPQNQLATVATLTTFEPLELEPEGSDSPEPVERTLPAVSGQAARGTRLPDSWDPSPEEALYAMERGFDPAAVLRMAEDFRDYWRAKPGQGGVKLDWPATWRRWVRTEAQRRAPQRAPPRRKEVSWC